MGDGDRSGAQSVTGAPTNLAYAATSLGHIPGKLCVRTLTRWLQGQLYTVRPTLSISLAAMVTRAQGDATARRAGDGAGNLIPACGASATEDGADYRATGLGTT
jgi:hypothetical protein